MSRLEEELARVLRDPAILPFVGEVLDRRDRQGRFPKRLTTRDKAFLRKVLSVFPRRALRSPSSNRVTVDLTALARILAEEARDRGEPPPALEALFDRVAGREAVDVGAARQMMIDRAVEVIREASAEGRRRARAAGAADDPEACARTAAPMIEETAAGRGPLLGFFGHAGEHELRERVAARIAAFLIARDPHREAVHLDDLSRAAAGDTKTFRPGGRPFRELVARLAETDPALAERIGALASPGSALFQRLLLEELGVSLNDTPVDVSVRGDLTYEIEGEELADPRRLAGLGLAAKLTLGAVRRACTIRTSCRRVLTIENESAYERMARTFPEHLCVFTAGHASWAVVLLLRKLAASSPATFHHLGDLDRSGLIILSSLRRRTGLDILPQWMDLETWEACRDRGLPMRREELKSARRLLDVWTEPWGGDVLARMVEEGLWIEQEEVLERRLGPA